jgi:hypothetical protein
MAHLLVRRLRFAVESAPAAKGQAPAVPAGAAKKAGGRGGRLRSGFRCHQGTGEVHVAFCRPRRWLCRSEPLKALATKAQREDRWSGNDKEPRRRV